MITVEGNTAGGGTGEQLGFGERIAGSRVPTVGGKKTTKLETTATAMICKKKIIDKLSQ